MSNVCEICGVANVGHQFLATGARLCGDECGDKYWRSLTPAAHSIIDRIQQELVSSGKEQDIGSENVHSFHNRLVELGFAKASISNVTTQNIGRPVSNANVNGLKDIGRSRETQEDYVDYKLNKKDGRAMLGVYDGHGGDSIAKTMAEQSKNPRVKRFLDVIDSEFKFLSDKELSNIRVNTSPIENLQKTTENLFLKYDQELDSIGEKNPMKDTPVLYDNQPFEVSKVGSTATLVALQTSNKKDQDVVYLAWLGDSRAVVYEVVGEESRAIAETRDHDANDQDARTRVSKFDKKKAFVDVANNRIGLKGIAATAVSRSFGDLLFKRQIIPGAYVNTNRTEGLVIAVPETKQLFLEDKKEYYVVVGSDGLWNFLQRRVGNDQLARSIKESKVIASSIEQSIGKSEIDRAVAAIAANPLDVQKAIGTDTVGKGEAVAQVNAEIERLLNEQTNEQIGQLIVQRIAPQLLTQTLLRQTLANPELADNVSVQVMRIVPLKA